MLLALRRIAIGALVVAFTLVALYGLPLAVTYNQPGAYDGDGEAPLYLLGWLSAMLVLIGIGGLYALFRFRHRLWSGSLRNPPP